MIKFGDGALKILINRLVAFGVVLKLILELFDVTTTRFGIDGGEFLPDLRRSCRARQGRLNRGGYGSKKRALYQLVLTSPSSELWIVRDEIVNG